MNCPHCHKEWPEGYGTGLCPFCGKEIHLQQTPLPNQPRMNWLVFYIVLFAPAAFNLVGLSTKAFALVIASTSVGSLLAGVICGLMLARYRDLRHGLTLLLILGLGVFSFILCFIGCAATTALMHR